MTAPCHYASRVSPRVETDAEKRARQRRDNRRTRFMLRETAGRLLGGRTARCGVVPYAGLVTVKRAEGTAHFSGVETCGSVWACPVCAAKVAERRRQEVEDLCRAHIAAGGRLYMAAFTMPHHRFQSAKELRDAVALAWRKTCSGKAWKEWRERLHLHYTRALEVTYGANGWHPHLHCLFYLPGDLSADERDRFSGWLFARWSRAIERLGYGICTSRVWRFEETAHTEAAGDYVAKWGADSEIARGVLKRAKGGQSPWELLQRAAEGDRKAARLFRVYAEAFRGARQLTHSRGLRDLYGVEELSDDDAAAAEPIVSEALGALTQAEYRALRRAGGLAVVLELAERDGWSAVDAYLQRKGVKGAEDVGRSRGGGGGAPALPRGRQGVHQRGGAGNRPW